MNDYETLKSLCLKSLEEKKLDDNQHKKRLKWELRELEVKNDCGYFIKIKNQGIKNLPNENNLLIPYLLDICQNFDINKEPVCTTGDLMDVDTDFVPEIQSYIRNEYIPRAFGKEYVCNVGSQNLLGLKSAILDTARIYDQDRNEALNATKTLQDKDEDGHPLSIEEAMHISPDLKKYCEKYPEIKNAANKLVGKMRSASTHAGGVIISSVKLSEILPLVPGKDGHPCSAWSEGQRSQDLSTLGLIKFDILGSETLNKNIRCIELVRKRHKIDKICATETGDNWSDISYLNDPKCLEMASRGDLKTVFQFDSDVVRNMCKKGGVDRFEDLVAYTSLNRPGCLDMGTDQTYIKRKKGEETYELHPLVEPILKDTYGIIIYQEQCVRLLNKVGLLSEVDCLKVQKAISKKKIEQFLKYKEKFIENGQNTLNTNKGTIEKIWAEIEAMAGYSFNLAHATSYTYTSARNLYLKCHYPVEWYAAVMSSMKTGDSRLQEYRYDGMKRGIIFNRLDINKSKANFHIDSDNSIYYALSKIKGIGDEMAEKIASLQPYKNFDDFLDRFGRQTTVVKPLLALRLFPEDEPINLYRRFENYKDTEALRTKIRTIEAKYNDKINELLPSEFKDIVNFKDINVIEPLLDSKTYNKILKAKDRYEKSVSAYLDKISKLEESEVEIDADYKELLLDRDLAEIAFLGWTFDSPLIQAGSSYDENHFDWFDSIGADIAPIDVKILKITEKKSKVKFYQLIVQDIYGVEKKINIWMSDYNIWHDELEEGNLLRMRLRKPDNGYPTYSLEGGRYIKYIRGKNDFRIINLINMKHE